MPYSSHLGLSLAVEHAVRLAPRSVLDVGAGFGKWGFLLREALDFMEGRVERDDWRVRIDGVDARRSSSPLLDWVYDEVRTCDVVEVAADLTDYDLVVMGDVLEHVEKGQGLALLATLLEQNRNVLLTTPFRFFEQEIRDAPYERHRSHWTIGDFAPWAFDYDVVGGFLVVALLAGRGAVRPAPLDARASRIAYALPLLRDRGSGARVVKAVVRGLLQRAGRAGRDQGRIGRGP